MCEPVQIAVYGLIGLFTRLFIQPEQEWLDLVVHRQKLLGVRRHPPPRIAKRSVPSNGCLVVESRNRGLSEAGSGKSRLAVAPTRQDHRQPVVFAGHVRLYGGRAE